MRRGSITFHCRAEDITVTNNNFFQLNTLLIQVLRIREFRNFILGRFVFIMGLRMMGTLVAWWMYEITGDPFYIGMIGLAEAIPAVGLSLYSGYIVDKSSKRNLLVVCVACFFMCALALLLISTPAFQLSFGKKVLVFFVYAVIFCTGIIRSFSGPSFGSIKIGRAHV